MKNKELEGNTNIAQTVADLPLLEQILDRGQLLGKLLSRNLIAAVRTLASAVIPNDEPYVDPRNGELTYSANGDDWHAIGSIVELADDDGDGNIVVGSEVYMGRIHYPDPAEFVDHEAVLSSMGDNAGQSDAGEWADDWPHPSEEAVAELKHLLDSWARRHCAPGFYLVKGSAKHIVTAEDLQ